MFVIDAKAIEPILKDYHIDSAIRKISELQRYHYERHDPASKEVRLIVRIDPEHGPALVLRFKNEKDVTLDLIESQCRFANALRQNGVLTPAQYQADHQFARWYSIGGYDVIVTVEQFAQHQVQFVDRKTARKTGALLARTHAISEENDLHVDNSVLFNPFTHNDLFSYDAFLSLESALEGENKSLFDRITALYGSYMDILAPLRQRPRYAVQGDISDCNLYLTLSGQLGLFDYNRSGDNILFCDAVMQAVFEARLMEYPPDRGDDFETGILTAFLEGYDSVRPFSPVERQWYPYLYAIIDAFWSSYIRWDEDCLLNAHQAGDSQGVKKWLSAILERLSAPCGFPLSVR